MRNPESRVQNPEEGEHDAGFALVCLECGGGLELGGEAGRCGECGRVYRRVDGIWRFLPAERAEAFAAFLQRYRVVRAAEGWGGEDPLYFRSLPLTEPGDPQHAIWRERARSFRVLIERVVIPLERERGRPLRIADLGAGNGWLANRLSRRGHRVAAVDLSDDCRDGLGARVWYDDAPFAAIQAELDRLPFADGAFDLVVFNASLHYASDCGMTLREALRVLGPRGRIVAMDSPLYRDGRSGAAMVREREARFRVDPGLGTLACASEGFLTDDRLAGLGRSLGLSWEVATPGFAWRRSIRSWRARLAGHREPAAFPVLVGTPASGGAITRGDAETRRLLGARCQVSGVGGGPGGPVTRHLTPGTCVSPRLRVRSLRGAALAIARRLVWWRFRLFQAYRHKRLVREDVAGYPILVLPGVFNPKLFRTGAFLAEALDARLVPAGARVLDLGTGSGIGAIAASVFARDVVATDLNPEAVRCARINVALNRVEDRVAVREGDLFGPVEGERFDLVLFNPPFFRGTPRDAADLAWRSPDVAERFAAGLAGHLTPGGSALVVLSSDGDLAGFCRAFRAGDLDVHVVARRRYLTETLAVYRLRPGRRR